MLRVGVLQLRSCRSNFPIYKRFSTAVNISDIKPKNDTVKKPIRSSVNAKSVNPDLEDLIKTFNGLLEDKKANEISQKQMEHNLKRQINKSDLFKEQLRLEEEQHSASIEEYNNTMTNLTNMGRATSTNAAKRSLVQWYGPVTESLHKLFVKLSDQNLKAKYVHLLPIVDIPIEQLTVVALNTIFNSVLRSGNEGSLMTDVSNEIGGLLETELNILRVRDLMKERKENRTKFHKDATKDRVLSNKRESQLLSKKLRSILSDEVEWDKLSKVAIGAELVDIVVKSVLKENGDPVFDHSVLIVEKSDDSKNSSKKGKLKKRGVLRMAADQYDQMKGTQYTTPRHLPMLVPPKEWDNKAYVGAYYRLKVPLMKTSSKSQVDAVKRAEMDDVLIALNYLGKTAWRINESVLEVIEEAQRQNILVGSIPSAEDLPLPDPSTCMSTPQQMQERKDAWRNNPRNAMQVERFDARKAKDEAAAAAAALHTESDVALEPKKSKFKKQREVRLPDQVLDLTSTEPILDERLYAEMCRRVKQKNSELHSLRCDLKIKMDIARQFRSQTMYYPHNLDFRGRAYPVPPNLSHLGSDLCRGLLLFEERRPLGAEGFVWLKVHLCNLYGNNKISMADRQAWTEEHIADILDSAENPLTGNRWWATFESPFQALACCKELKAVLECPDPTQFMSNLPVHQDGSCNGLQHYAGLGRDSKGALAVNLIPSDKPQDVYTKVLEEVVKQIDLDAQRPEMTEDQYVRPTLNIGKLARSVQGKIVRKTIKQTVMTSVYGVTGTGARAQVQARLEDRFKEDNPGVMITPEVDKVLYYSANYVAALTLKSLGELFGSAKSIMDWLGECSTLVSKQDSTMAWVTPMGLPVIQPYRRAGSTSVVNTTLQSITLVSESDDVRVSARKQRSAFPPNFVHSMDATHMLMTCLKMKNEGKVFASVHDSYWTHACDVNLMNDLLRECFVHLYEYPVLDDLKDSLDFRFPDVDFPEIPQRGDLDIKVVKNSKYFFH